MKGWIWRQYLRSWWQWDTDTPCCCCSRVLRPSDPSCSAAIWETKWEVFLNAAGTSDGRSAKLVPSSVRSSAATLWLLSLIVLKEVSASSHYLSAFIRFCSFEGKKIYISGDAIYFPNARWKHLHVLDSDSVTARGRQASGFSLHSAL